MTQWRPLPGEELVLYSPIGLLLVDEFTGKTPIGGVEAELDLQDGTEWRSTEVKAVLTPSGIVAYPGLGRRADVGHPAQHYRVRLETLFYRPLYRASDDGIEFDAPPYNDANTPANVTKSPVTTLLVPRANYPFPPYVPVLHGVVRDTNGDPVSDVLVQEALRERVLTDARGSFTLPLRWVPSGVATTINATDQRNGRAGSISVTLPAALTQSQTITVS